MNELTNWHQPHGGTVIKSSSTGVLVEILDYLNPFQREIAYRKELIEKGASLRPRMTVTAPFTTPYNKSYRPWASGQKKWLPAEMKMPRGKTPALYIPDEMFMGQGFLFDIDNVPGGVNVGQVLAGLRRRGTPVYGESLTTSQLVENPHNLEDIEGWYMVFMDTEDLYQSGRARKKGVRRIAYD